MSIADFYIQKYKIQKYKNQMKILILGSSGQLGSDIKKIFNSVNILRKNEIEYTKKNKVFN